MTPNIIIQQVIDAFDGPKIYPTMGDSRSNRMSYYKQMGAIKDGLLQLSFKDHITIIARKGRVIVGPKDFGAYLMAFVDLAICSQEELTQAYDLYYPDEMKFDYKSARKRWDESVRQEREEKAKAQAQRPGNPENMSDKAKELAIQFGFLKPTKTEKQKDPYETYAEKEEEK